MTLPYETTPLMAQAFGAMPATFVTGGYFDTASAVPNVWLRKYEG